MKAFLTCITAAAVLFLAGCGQPAGQQTVSTTPGIQTSGGVDSPNPGIPAVQVQVGGASVAMADPEKTGMLAWTNEKLELFKQVLILEPRQTFSYPSQGKTLDGEFYKISYDLNYQQKEGYVYYTYLVEDALVGVVASDGVYAYSAADPTKLTDKIVPIGTGVVIHNKESGGPFYFATYYGGDGKQQKVFLKREVVSTSPSDVEAFRFYTAAMAKQSDEQKIILLTDAVGLAGGSLKSYYQTEIDILKNPPVEMMSEEFSGDPEMDVESGAEGDMAQ